MKIENLGHWVEDYFYMSRGHTLALLNFKPPAHYLGHVQANKVPIVLLPGVYTRWHFLKSIADPLSKAGHPIYVLEHLGYNFKEIDKTAKLVSEFIDAKRLTNVILLAHSKGGLIGKYLLAFHNHDHKIKKLIAVASPFGGSNLVRFFKFGTLAELSPSSSVVKKLQEYNHANKDIVSIFGIFDNHVWPEDSCKLPGAKNIQVSIHGHHKILFDNQIKKIVMGEIEVV